MAKSADDLSALFRSLGPDDSGFRVTETAAAREAEQRWPLFQAVAPKKMATTPTLSTQERDFWSQQKQYEGRARKPALSLPGLSDKMAKSLGKMSGRPADAPMQNLSRRAAPEAPVPIAPLRSVPEVAVAEPRGLLFASFKASQAADSQPSGSEPLDSVVGDAPSRSESGAIAPTDGSSMWRTSPQASPLPDVQTSGLGLFDSMLKGSSSPPHSEAEAETETKAESIVTTDDSIASIFKRLEGPPKIISKPVDKKSSFLSRLGKR